MREDNPIKIFWKKVKLQLFYIKWDIAMWFQRKKCGLSKLRFRGHKYEKISIGRVCWNCGTCKL